MHEEINLGDYVVDELTGSSGRVSAKCEYLGGSTQYLVESLIDGEHQEIWFQAGRISKAN